MRSAQLGRSGPAISRIGIGTWAIGGPYEYGWGPVDDDESISAIHRAIDLGVDWIDTAPVYGHGHSEEVVGRALTSSSRRDGVRVFTKCGRVYQDGRGVNDLRPAALRRECDDSLARLGVDVIDVYQIHWPEDSPAAPLEDAWATMAALVDEGKVRWAGLCNGSAENLRKCEPVRHVDSMQPLMNLLRPGAARGVVPACRANGTGVIVHSTLAQGLLTGKFDRAAVRTLAEDDWRRRSEDFTPPRLDRNLDAVAVVQQVAEALSSTPAAVAVAWALAVPGVTGAIVGARRPAQVDGWIDAAVLELGQEELSALWAAAAPE